MKNNLIVLGLIGFSLSASAQQKLIKKPLENGYTINGNITALTAPYVYIYAPGKRDSAAVKDGKFTYKGSVKAPVSLYLSDSHQKFALDLYVENVPVTIIGKISDPENIIVKGGKTQQELNVLEASLKEGEGARTKLYAAYGVAEAAKDEVAIKRIEADLKKIQLTSVSLTKKFIASHLSSYVSLDKIKGMGYNADYSEIYKLYQTLDPALRASERGKEFETALSVLKRGGNGQKMIDFTQNDMNGKPVCFSSFKGKYVLVDFWASWCGPCRAENPNVLKAYQKFESKGFTVLGVSLDDNAEKWKKAVEEDKMPWTQVSDLKGWKNEVSTYYGIRGIPSNYLVNAEGIIVARNLRGADLENKLKELLGDN